MKETLGTRVSRIVAGSVNALIDAVENVAPEAVMEQAIREIESALSEVRADLGGVEAQRHLTSKRLAEESQRHEELGEQAEIALQQNRDDLATVALERQLDIEAQLPVLEAGLAELGEQRKKLEGYIAALQAKRREMLQALEDFRRQRAAEAAAAAQAPNAGTRGAAERAERAGGAFDRIYSRHTGLRGTSGASAEQAAKLSELEDLARNSRVEERLARLKARLDDK